MRHLKLYENFNDRIDYVVRKVGNDFRIFALTPKMREEGKYDHEDAETLFGSGSMWRNYSSWQEVRKVIDSYNREEGMEEME
jgi:hypothetical protein